MEESSVPRAIHTIPDEILLEVAAGCLEQKPDVRRRPRSRAPRLRVKTIKEVARELNESWLARGVDFEIGRQQVYAALAEARRRGLLQLTPPTHARLQELVCARFGQDARHVRVVATESRQIEMVSRAAAELVLELILGLQRQGKTRVQLGFGAGWTPRVVAYQLAALLRSTPDAPDLVIRAISTGMAHEQVISAPVTFFGFFEAAARKVEYVGMFAQPFVPWDGFAAASRQPGVREAFAERGAIDIVVSALASGHDEHSGLRTIARKQGYLPQLEAAHWVGDVQHLPYSNRGPITGVGERPFTLFDLKQLGAAVKQGRHVVLVSPLCAACSRTRADALLPLLTVPALKIWTHLVTDIPTARQLLELGRGST
jgi:DNA-binding transcriptional regulator LsrR (DeoR family)